MSVRVLEVVAKMNRAGTETMLMNFYRNIDRSEVQFDFAVCTNDECDYEEEIISMGGRIYRYPKYTGKNHFQYQAWWDKFFTEHGEYKIVHGHIGSTAAIYLGIAKKHGVYTIAHSHGTKEPLSIRSALYQLFSYRTRFIADYFFGCSMQALIDRYGEKIAHSDRAKVLNNAIDAKKYAYDEIVRKEVREELNLPDGLLTIGTVGRLSPAKNPAMTLRIIQDLMNNGIRFKFIWVGDGELKEDIDLEIKKRGVVDSVIMLGVRNDVHRILQALDVFIFPSIWEGLGIVAIEAQAAGLPTLCSDSVPKEAKVTGLCNYIPINAENEWSKAIVSHMHDKRRITTDEIIKANYDIHSVARWLRDFYISRLNV